MAFDFTAHNLCHTRREGGVVVIRPVRFEQNGQDLITWSEPTHDRAFVIEKVIKDTDKEFRFLAANDVVFTLRPLTLDIYRSTVRGQLMDGAPDFKTDADLRQAFLTLDIY